MIARLLFIGGAIAGALPASTPAQPTFDCDEATGTVETLICADSTLAGLDRELADVWERALRRVPEEERATLRAYQRGWIEGRNDCWKSDDIADCVRTEYLQRIAALEVQGGLVEVPEPVRFACETGRDLLVTFYSSTRWPVAVLTSGEEQVRAFGTPTGSGTRYLGPGVDFREHHGEVSLEWMGERTTCEAVIPNASGRVSCERVPAGAVIVTMPRAGEHVVVPFDVSGCSSTFEGTVSWRLLARDGRAIAEGHATGGGMEPAPLRFTVDVDTVAVGLHHLEVFEPRVTDEGFPPGRTVLPIILRDPSGAGAPPRGRGPEDGDGD